MEGNFAAFYALVDSDVSPKVKKYITRVFPSLSDDDADDCFQDALWGLVERQGEGRMQVSDPRAYIWQSAKNAALDLLKERGWLISEEEYQRWRMATERKRGRRALENEPADVPDGEGGTTGESVVEGIEGPSDDPPEISGEVACVLVEAAVEDTEAEPSWAKEVVQASLQRLRPALRKPVEHLISRGLDFKSCDAPTDLNVKARTFRANKSKAYTELRRVIPAVMREMGIDPLRHRIPEFEVIAQEQPLGEETDEGDEDSATPQV